MIISAGQSAHWSAKYDPETRLALQSGRVRVEITVNAYRPADEATSLVLRLVLPDGTTKQIDQFAIFPNAPFNIADGAVPQRFLISLADYAKWLAGDEIGLEVGFASDAKAARGGTAEISMKLTDAPAK